MKLTSIFIAIILNFCPWAYAGAHHSKLVYPGPGGKLLYRADQQGNFIPDFSNAGYEGGGIRIPDISAVATLAPGNGDDDTERIQMEVDKLSARKADGKGFRGALLLKRGTYRVSGTIRVKTGGLVIRGEGQEPGGTVILATGKEKQTLFKISGKGRPFNIQGTRADIVDNYVPVGARSLTLSSVRPFKIGDRVIIHRPATKQWIHDIGMDRIPGAEKQWQPQKYHMRFERVITGISESRIQIDSPIVQAMESRYGGGQVYKYDFPGRISQIGLEHLRLVSEYNGADDEDHGWRAIVINKTENAWVRNVTAVHFGYACVYIGKKAKHVTVQDCAYLDGISKIAGGRRYAFAVNGQLNLVQRCYSRGGRHDFVFHSRTPGPNVFLDCVAENSLAPSEPHHRWTVGALYDRVSVEGPKGFLMSANRGNSGTGHGWAGANVVFWNSRAALIVVIKPPTAQNYAIGLIESIDNPTLIDRTIRWLNRPDKNLTGNPYRIQGVFLGDGYIESIDKPVEPSSLYLRQIEDRVGKKALENVTIEPQRRGPVFNLLRKELSR